MGELRGVVELVMCGRRWEAQLSGDKEIKACITETASAGAQLREERAKDSDNLSIIKQRRKEKTKVMPRPATKGQQTSNDHISSH